MFALLFALSLAGQWTVSGEGIGGSVRLPGSLAENGVGVVQTYQTWQAEPDLTKRHVLVPSHTYVGEAVYARTFTMPAELAARPTELVLERVMWRSEVRIDGRVIGSRDSLGTPHVYRLEPGALSVGEHRLEIAVDNRQRYGFSGRSHGWGWHTQTLWNGFLGVCCHYFFIVQDALFGTGNGFGTLAAKTAFDQFVWTAFVIAPANAVFYFWASRGFSFRRTRGDWPKGFFRNLVLPNLLMNWAVGIPNNFAVYSFPTPLRVQVIGILGAFWVLVCLQIGRRSGRSTAE